MTAASTPAPPGESRAADALNDAVRALRDICALDPDRPCRNDAERVARRSLERITGLLRVDVLHPGHTHRPTEDLHLAYPPARSR